MEFKPLPAQHLSGKTYKHFKADSYSIRDKEADCNIEFFYLGRKSSKIDLLIKTFESGYAAETVESAKSVLKRITERNRIPDLIIIDASISASDLKELHYFLASSNHFKALPFVVDASDISSSDIAAFRSMRFVDDIIFVKESATGTLKQSVVLLIKMKRAAERARNEQQNRTWFIIGRLLRKYSRRIFDIVIASIAILLLSPVFLLIALAIRLESKGPIFYVAQRAGCGYRIFKFFKFRTMIDGADKEIEQLLHLNNYNATDEIGAVFFKVINDTRITKVGNFLRNSSMDELPQFFNILLGDMSLVGNRPLPLYEAAKLTTNQWAERFMAPAGITGLWQIKKRKLDKISIEERINLDIAYSQKYGFMYDLWIIANTPLALIQRSNA